MNYEIFFRKRNLNGFMVFGVKVKDVKKVQKKENSIGNVERNTLMV